MAERLIIRHGVGWCRRLLAATRQQHGQFFSSPCIFFFFKKNHLAGVFRGRSFPCRLRQGFFFPPLLELESLKSSNRQGDAQSDLLAATAVRLKISPLELSFYWAAALSYDIGTSQKRGERLGTEGSVSCFLKENSGTT
jgi:hypothetical protein